MNVFLIILGVVTVMSVIGYFAEKTPFGQKLPGARKKKKEEMVIPPVPETKHFNDEILELNDIAQTDFKINEPKEEVPSIDNLVIEEVADEKTEETPIEEPKIDSLVIEEVSDAEVAPDPVVKEIDQLVDKVALSEEQESSNEINVIPEETSDIPLEENTFENNAITEEVNNIQEENNFVNEENIDILETNNNEFIIPKPNKASSIELDIDTALDFNPAFEEETNLKLDKINETIRNLKLEDNVDYTANTREIPKKKKKTEIKSIDSLK